MKTEKIVFGLDIGTTKIVCLAGKLNEHGKLEIVSVGRSKSLGVKRGIVNNIMQTVESINHAVNLVHQDSGLDVESVCTGIAGQHIRSLQHQDYITRDNPEDFINAFDVEKLHEDGKEKDPIQREYHHVVNLDNRERRAENDAEHHDATDGRLEGHV